MKFFRNFSQLIAVVLFSVIFAVDTEIVTDCRALVTISESSPEEERSFLHCTSHPSDRLLREYRRTNGKISLSSKEDLLALQDDSYSLYTSNDSFIFDFSSQEIEISDIEEFSGWSRSSKENSKNLKSVVSDLFNILEILTSETLAESTLRARSLLNEAYETRTPEKAKDFRVSEKSIFSDGGVEINATDIISGASKFIFAENSIILEQLLQEIPASSGNYFVLGYSNFHGFYSPSLKTSTALEIIAERNILFGIKDLRIDGWLGIIANGNIHRAGGKQSSKGGELIAGGKFVCESVAETIYDSGDRKLVISDRILRTFNNDQDFFLKAIEVLRILSNSSEVIIRKS